MPGTGLGECIACGEVATGRACGICGALVLFDEGTPEWSTQHVGLRFERCTVHGLTERPADKCILAVDDELVSIIDRKGEKWLDWNHESIQSIEVDDYAGMKARLTATRFVFMGALAFFVPKRTSVAYLWIESNSESAFIEVPGLTPPTLRAQLGAWVPEAPMAHLPPPPQTSEAMPNVASIKDRLQVLDALLAAEAISPDEHSARRTAILDSI